MFGQTFDAHDLLVISLLIVLEGVLSIDNALVLGLLAKRLPKHQQKRALTYGLVGAFVFRLIASGTAVYLMKWWFVKLVGGLYLLYIAIKHLFFESPEEHPEHITATPEGEVVLVD
jgi:predicted tellurium resistance membrane protein TerC